LISTLSVNGGADLTCTIVASNNGPDAAIDVVVHDNVPAWELPLQASR
jgi:uncharacterized repeat protein (TIGR01451 family)